MTMVFEEGLQITFIVLSPYSALPIVFPSSLMTYSTACSTFIELPFPEIAI